LLFMRLIQFTGLAVKFFLQIDNGRMAAARRYRQAARLRLSSLATPRFGYFTAYGARPFHLALQFDRRTISYHSIELCCASQQFRPPDVRLVPKAAMQQKERYSITSSASRKQPDQFGLEKVTRDAAH